MVAMAVAIHCNFTKRMDYHYKNFDVNTWKFFGAWNILKNSPKFQHHPPNVAMPSGVATMNESGDDKENGTSSPEPNVSFDVAYAKAPYSGKKSSVEKRHREKVEKEKEEAKKARHAQILTSLNESKSYLAHISDVNEQVKKHLTLFTCSISSIASYFICIITSSRHCIIASLPHRVVTSLRRCVSSRHRIIASSSRRIIMSLRRCIIAL